ncbi:MAG: HAMP domain-containing histidine kinase [Christensenellaceae bacterium]|nr:HAMP domain-containing histidine kinase [Christensenellaceae bacterium]
MVKRAIHPYSFRARLMLGLLISSALAAIIALALSLAFSHVSLEGEVEEREQTMALYLLELDQKTDLSLEQMLRIAQQDNLSVSLAEENGALDSTVLSVLDDRMIHTASRSWHELPVTYVRLGDGSILRIGLSHEYNLFWIAFFRIVFAAISFLAVFAAMATLAAIRFSKPITELTAATRAVQQGDFTVRMPENAPGEIGELMRSFNGMADELSRTAYLQKDFISSVSHEFRTPISSIRGFARLLQMPGLTEEQRQEYVGLIAQESDRLSRLSETLLRLSALEQQTGPASLSEFRLDEQLRQVILRLEPEWSARDIDWQLDLADVTIRSDEALLTHVWVNLLQNAVKFSEAGGCIEVRVYKTDQAVIEVADHGIGMDEETMARIFDRFYQADGSRSREGVGLGLCLVKRILDMLGGQVKVQSKPGLGSTFRVMLPMNPVENND